MRSVTGAPVIIGWPGPRPPWQEGRGGRGERVSTVSPCCCQGRAMISGPCRRLPDISRRCRRPDWARREPMGKVLAGITISVDGLITGPGDGPGCGLGVGGERLHYWVFGGPWSYDSPGRGEPAGEDKAWLEGTMGANGAVVAGRGTYEAAGHWGGKNPWGIPFFVVTHRPAEQPPGDDFTFVGS